MSFSYWLFSFVVLAGFPAGFWALHQFLLNKYLYKMKKVIVICIHALIGVVFCLLAWFFPLFGALFFIASLACEIGVLWYIVHKSALGKVIGV
jgi:hypothetical protein